jgi:hypothetical protein
MITSVSKSLTGIELAMHDFLIASSFIAMLVVPCFTAMKTDVAAEDNK